jgi:ferredoxin-NADP reductase
VIAVGRDAASRGGSIWVHDNLHAGSQIEVTAPRNSFEMDETAPASVLVAGGIGVTPLLAMARQLNRSGADWQIVYAVRSRAHAALLDELIALSPERVRLHADDEAGGVLDLAAVIAGAPQGAHFYACGPTPMMAAFEAATAALPAERRHVEYFTNTHEAATEGGYQVALVRSGITVTVQNGQTILQAVEKEGVDVPFSCMEGVCGTCETRVLAGRPDHRDLVLSDAEKERNDLMMICCSGSLDARLELDL